MSCDDVYTERNRLVAALTKFFPSVMIRDLEAEEGWQNIVYIMSNAGQLSWHIPDSEVHLFKHISVMSPPRLPVWDGHTTEEKYERLSKVERDETETRLSFRESQVVDKALKSAFLMESSRLSMVAAAQGKQIYAIERSLLYTMLNLALGYIERNRYHAEEMGG